MLPGFRFLFAATLLTLSLVVFGLGAAALLRASHERFASLPTHPAPAPVFTQIADTAPPTLSMLRIETPDAAPGSAPTPPQIDTLSPTDKIATLSAAPRVEDPIVAPPAIVVPIPEVKAEIKPELPNVEAKAETALEPATPAVAATAPVAEAVAAVPAAAPAPMEQVAAANIAEPAKVETPAPVPERIAALPEADITGTTAAAQATIDPPLVNAKPIRRPPVPKDRPANADVLAALPAPIAAATIAEIARPVVRKRKVVVRRAVRARRPVAPQRPAAAAPASPFGTTTGFGT